MGDNMLSEESGLTDLLEQAEQLTANMPSANHLPRVERNLRQIMEVGEQLWTKTAHSGISNAATDATADVKASILLGSKGIDLPRMSQKLEAFSVMKTMEPLEPIHQTDIQGFLKNERENAILTVIEESSQSAFKRAEKLHWKALESEWEQEKQKILNDLLVGREEQSLDLKLDNEVLYKGSVNLQTPSALNNVEMLYVRQVMLYNENVIQGGIKDNLCDKFAQVATKLNDKNIQDLWMMVSSMCSIRVNGAKDVPSLRTSKSMHNSLIKQARHYLETKYVDFIKATICGNLQTAQLGGVPGIFHLIKSFLNIKLSNCNYPGLEDGTVDGQPVWPVIYYCIRCGDLHAALQAAQSAGPALKEFASYLKEFMNNDERRLNPSSETKIRLEYRRSVRTCSDPFKRIVYCIIACCDVADFHSEVADKTEDFLWLRLCLIQTSKAQSDAYDSTDSLTLEQLQAMLLDEYGESHFNAYEQPFLYFQVLFLTGQFEAAIEFLARIQHLTCHAVHIAIALHQCGLLCIPNSTQSSLLSCNEADASPMRRLNFAKLITMYTRKFEATDPVEALNYFYLLRELKGSGGTNLFRLCISELVMQTREFDLLLGTLQPDCCRTPGAIDKLRENVNEVIEVVAADCESKGQFEDAVKLFDLAKKHDKVLELMNKLLSQVIAQPSNPQSKRDRLHGMAESIARRFKNFGHNASKQQTSTFYLLLDLCTFFNFYFGKNLQEALNIMSSINLIPLQSEHIEERVDNFRYLTDEIRRNIPDVLLAVMDIIHCKYKAAKASQQQSNANMILDQTTNDKSIEYLRKQAKSLITFAGMIPYRMPGDTNASLVQLEVLIN